MLTDAALDDSPYKIAVNATSLVDQDRDHEVWFFLWWGPNVVLRPVQCMRESVFLRCKAVTLSQLQLGL